MSSRPLTPPYVPFGIRRFNRISAIDVDARTAQESHNILPVRAFRLLWNETAPGFQRYASTPDGSFPIGKPAIPVSQLAQVLYLCSRLLPLFPDVHSESSSQPFAPALQYPFHVGYMG